MKANKIILNNELLMDLTKDTVTEADVVKGKTFHKADGSEAVGTRASGTLAVSENGTYEATYTAASFTWDENTEYDGTADVEGIPLRYKKVASLCVPEDVEQLYRPDFAFTFTLPDGTTQRVPLVEMNIVEQDGAIIIDDLLFAVVWIKDASLINEGYGTNFESNTVYVTDFLWTMAGEELTGAAFTLTAPGEKVDAFSSVSVEIVPALQEKIATENGEVIPDDGYNGLSKVTVAVESTGGLAINGTVKQYRVDDGASVQAGDFVSLVSKYGSGSFASAVSTVASCSISAERKVVLYTDTTASAVFAQIVDVADDIVLGNPVQVFSGTIGYVHIIAVDETTLIAARETEMQAITIDGNNMTLGVKQTVEYRISDITQLNNMLFAIVYGYHTNNAVYVQVSLYRFGDDGFNFIKTITVGSNTNNTYSAFNSLDCASIMKLNDANILATYAFKDGSSTYRFGARVCSYSNVGLGNAGYYSEQVSNHMLLQKSCRLADNSAVVVGKQGSTCYAYNFTNNGSTLACVKSELGATSPAEITAIGENKVLFAYGSGDLSLLGIDKDTGAITTLNTAKANGSYGYGYIELEPISENNILAFARMGYGGFLNINTDNDTITIIEDTNADRGTFVRPATSYFNNVGVAATGGASGETVDVYVVG